MPNIPNAIIDAMDNKDTIGAGIQQAQGDAHTLEIPFAFSNNGDCFKTNDSDVFAFVTA